MSILCIVTWWLTETRRWEWYSPPPVELKLSSSQKVTCGNSIHNIIPLQKKKKKMKMFIFQASIKNSTKSISPWKKRNSPVEPRQKNKISNFGTFFRYTQILLPLSLSICKSQEKTFIFMDYPIIYLYFIYKFSAGVNELILSFMVCSVLVYHGPKLFPHVICQFLSAWEKNSEQDLFL